VPSGAWFITGLSDGESSFSVTIYESNIRKAGWHATACFVIELNERDVDLLYKIESGPPHYRGGNFGVGTVSITKKQSAVYLVRSTKELKDVIIPHFVKYPLLLLFFFIF
jgi:hypothetical protein